MPSPSLVLLLPTYASADPGSWDHVAAAARAADEVGFGGVACADHVAFGENLEAYARPELGGAEGGVQSAGSDGPWLEPLTVLATLIPVTRRVRLTTNVLLAALRPAVVLAKTAATLDVLSGGRVELGVGVGWQKEEYDAVGLDFHRRGDLLDECLEVCQLLWRRQVTDHVSGALSLRRLHAMPKPVQRAGVPIWVSGTINERVVRRVVRFGAGWSAWGPDAADPAPGIARLRDALAANDRDPSELGVRVLLQSGSAMPTSEIVEHACRLAEIGVTQIVFRVPLTRSVEDNVERLAPIVTGFGQRVRALEAT